MPSKPRTPARRKEKPLSCWVVFSFTGTPWCAHVTKARAIKEYLTTHAVVGHAWEHLESIGFRCVQVKEVRRGK